MIAGVVFFIPTKPLVKQSKRLRSLLMGDVVHYRSSLSFTMAECGKQLGINSPVTADIINITCPDCLKKLGVKPEVDEEKMDFAKAIVGVIPDRKKLEVFKKAEVYLKSVKGEL
jgi:hypothetical protein